MWILLVVLYRPCSASVFFLPLLLGLYIPGASQWWCCRGFDCWGLLHILNMLLCFFRHNYIWIVVVGSSSSVLWTCHSIVYNMNSVTQIVAYVYNTVLFFLLIVHIWWPILEGQYWLLNCGNGCSNPHWMHSMHQLYVEWFLMSLGIFAAVFNNNSDPLECAAYNFWC